MHATESTWSTQTTWPKANHTYSNHCKPATPSMVVAACLDSYYIPENIDLILFEVSGARSLCVLVGWVCHKLCMGGRAKARSD